MGTQWRPFGIVMHVTERLAPSLHAAALCRFKRLELLHYFLPGKPFDRKPEDRSMRFTAYLRLGLGQAPYCSLHLPSKQPLD